ncbi:exocyst complex component 8-like isoform X2 [Apostichopus japonicus]|uniref:exocyst complex component 8-like isoform X2 n=1 Tax=Stichopus japonicus TaxID=307972 RepID=UPI003AB28642
MADAHRKALSKSDFDANCYVQEISSGGDVYQDLIEEKQRIQKLSDDTSVALKKNVYRNYKQFIDTAKEISYLEGEMYQLSHLLTEQKSIMGDMLEMSNSAKDESSKDKLAAQNPDDKKRSIASLLDRVEGCSRIAEIPNRYIVHDGDLVELDGETYLETQKVHIYLLNDSLVVTTFIRNRRGPVRYKFQALFELDSLAVVNVRDVECAKNAFKVLRFPDQHIYCAENAKTKRDWLDRLEEAKKIQAAASTQKRGLTEQILQSPAAFDENNPFAAHIYETTLQNAEWLEELPEDLDMSIAQRNFEEAADMVLKATRYLEQIPMTPPLKEVKSRVDNRVKQLTDVLTRELQGSPEKSLRGGPQVTRRAVTQLIRLGRSTLACDLYLKNRSTAIKQSLRYLKIEGAAHLYVTKLCRLFFNHIIETGKEFKFTFNEQQGCFSAFVVWTKAELKGFVNQFSRQALAKQSNIGAVADCVTIARTHCSSLSVIGLDLTFVLNSLMLKGMQDVLQYNKEQLIEASRHRNMEEKWYPMNLKNPNAANTLIGEMQKVGYENFQQLVYDQCFVKVATSTVAFVKVVLSFLREALKLYIPELHPDIISVISEVVENHVDLMSLAAKSDRFEDGRANVMNNIDYIFQEFLPLVESKIQNVSGKKVHHLKDIRAKNKAITRKIQSAGVLI